MQGTRPAGREAERQRLEEDARRIADWKRWGPYLSERQWGTVREDYSADGDPWRCLPHDAARSRAYRWGEDVKEHYYYLEATPTHSYGKALCKYPQAEFPYERLREENRRRGLLDPEFEVEDTGVFGENRYFDVFAEYAKAAPDDVLIRLTCTNRGPDPAPLHVLMNVWFRNTWSWGRTGEGYWPRPSIERDPQGGLRLAHATLGKSRFRLFDERQAPEEPFGAAFDRVFDARVAEANEFYDSAIPADMNPQAQRVARQAYAGLL
jgi:hypothetical protein